MSSIGDQPTHPSSSRLPQRLHTGLSVSSSNTTTSVASPSTSNNLRRPTTATSSSSVTIPHTSDVPLSGRAGILDHTHAVNNSVNLAASNMHTSTSATATDQPSSSRFDTTSTIHSGDAVNVGKTAGSSRLSVRRALGQRAESESIAALRRGANRQSGGNKHRTLSSHFDDSVSDVDHLSTLKGKRSSVDGRVMSTQASRAPFATVKRIFRSRSKSQSTPSGAKTSSSSTPHDGQVGASNAVDASSTVDAVPAVPPMSTSAISPALMSTQPSVKRQSKDNSRAGSFLFSFGRARPPPSRAKSTSSHLSNGEGSVLTTRRQTAKSFTSSIASPPPTNYGADGGRDDDGVAIEGTGPSHKRERKISGLPTSSSDGHSLAFGFNRSRTDRALTLQSLSGTSSPYGVRRSSLSSTGALSPRYGTLEVPSHSSHTPRTDGTPTPTTAYFPRGTEGVAEEKDTAKLKQGTPDRSVPKMWQLAQPSRSSTIDESPPRNTSQQGRRQESSTTSGSALSFRTAQSYAEDSPPDLPRLSIDTARQRKPGMLDAITSIPRSAASPLTDLIENLEQRMSSSSTGASTPTRDSIARRAIAQTTTNASTPVSVRFPTRAIEGHTGHTFDEQDEDESTFSRISVSSSSRTPSPPSARRNTFGNDLGNYAGQAQQGETNYWDRPTQRESGANVSMHDIENSLAAVEAALQDHRRAGSIDPNLLLQHIVPRSAGAVNSSNTSFPNMDNGEDAEMLMDEQEPLARVTLPPDQQYAIANAVKQVRRAISSSQLPQIPSEEDSDATHSPTTDVAPPLNGASASSAAVMSTGMPKSELLTIPMQKRKGSGASNESTPLRAARIRQESMQDVEQAYARMVELVSSAAGIDLTTSPMPATRTYARRSTLSQPSPLSPDALDSPVNASQYMRERTQGAVPTSFLTPSAMQVWTSVSPALAMPPLPPVNNTTVNASTRSARQQLLRESDALSRGTGPLPDLSEETLEQQQSQNETLRGRTSNLSLGSRRAMSSSPKARFYRDAMDIDATSSAAVASYDRGQSPSGADSGGVHTASGTSPSIVAKTQGSAYTPGQGEALQGRHPTATASVFYPASHNRSASAQNVYEWQQNRARYPSPGSVRIPQSVTASTAAKRISVGSNDVPRSSSEIHRQIADELAQRRMRAAQHHLSGSSAGVLNDARLSPEQVASVFGSAAGSAAQHATDSGTGSYRRSGSVRDWGRMEDLASFTTGLNGSVRPSSNLSGGVYNNPNKNAHVVRKSDGSDLSEAARLAFINQRIGSPASSSVIAMQQRHALERDSLLDMLDRTRSEAHELSTHNEHLRADLHLEVTRVLELERECERRKQNEEQLARRVQALEEELKVEQADRVRIGELLERVQRAVDEAANARSGGGLGTSGMAGVEGIDSGELLDGSSADAGQYRRSNDPRILEEMQSAKQRQHEAPSPTSSSVSIRQEDLLPIKTRIFDVSGTVDDQELLHGLTTTGHGHEHSIFDLYGQSSHASRIDGSSSPSLDSHASQLGLTLDHDDQDWSLDEEVLPDAIAQANVDHQEVLSTPRTPDSKRLASGEQPHTPLRHTTKRSPVISNSTSSAGQKHRFPSLTLVGRSDRTRSTSNDGTQSDDPPTPSASPRSIRQVSRSSRTTAADTSAFTSPAGSTVPVFGGATRKVTPNAVMAPSRIPMASAQHKRASVDTKAYAAMQSRIPQMISAATAAKPTLQNDHIVSSAAMRTTGSNDGSADLYGDQANSVGVGAASLLRIRSNEHEQQQQYS